MTEAGATKMTDDWQRLGTIETDAHRRLNNPQTDFEWICTVEERAVFYGELKGYAAEHPKWKPGWAAMKYKDRFGYFPERNVEATPAMECSIETRLRIQDDLRNFWRRAKPKGERK